MVVFVPVALVKEILVVEARVVETLVVKIPVAAVRLPDVVAFPKVSPVIVELGERN